MRYSLLIKKGLSSGVDGCVCASFCLSWVNCTNMRSHMLSRDAAVFVCSLVGILSMLSALYLQDDPTHPGVTERYIHHKLQHFAALGIMSDTLFAWQPSDIKSSATKVL